jgi:hypothetical protein
MNGRGNRSTERKPGPVPLCPTQIPQYVTRAWTTARPCPLTMRSWSLLERSPVVQPFKNFPVFYETVRFISTFSRAFHWSVSWARQIQSIPPYAFSPRSILMLSTYLLLIFASGLFPSGSPTNDLYALIFSSIHSTYVAHLILLDLIIVIIRGE